LVCRGFSTCIEQRDIIHPRKSPRSRIGFTIIEATISVAIVGILMATSLTSMGEIAKSRRIQSERRSGFELAQQLMTEIRSQYFQDPGGSPVFGPEPGETRATFDDVDDYNGYTETPPALKTGTALTDFTGWTRSVVVCYVDPANPTTAIASSTLKQITVTVTSPGQKKYILTAWRSQYGAYESTPPTLATYVTWAGVDLNAGSTPRTIHTGARPLNETASQP
jgi:MSHA pilin protein MshD